MANEIKITKTINYENGQLKYTYQPGTLQLPQATRGIHLQSIAATSVAADVAVATLGTPGLCVLQNLEPTTTGKTWNWGLKSSTGGIPQYFALKPKHVAMVNYGTSAMVIRGQGAAAGTVIVQVLTFEA